ncbi:MAG: hypothetical protein GY696_25225 [Gammaproteobacteria bacterium]|nr:hypothetical protein [Gammaproteobacteria bacterium]
MSALLRFRYQRSRSLYTSVGAGTAGLWVDDGRGRTLTADAAGYASAELLPRGCELVRIAAPPEWRLRRSLASLDTGTDDAEDSSLRSPIGG